MIEKYWPTVLLVWTIVNAISRSIPDAQWARLPQWLRTLLEVSRAIGSDPVKAIQKVKGDAPSNAASGGPDAV